MRKLPKGTKSREKQGDGAQPKHSKQEFKKTAGALTKNSEKSGRARPV